MGNIHYKTIFQEENEMIQERYGLAVNRVREIPQETLFDERFQEYFHQVAQFISFMSSLAEDIENGKLDNCSLQELQNINQQIYGDILGIAYENSYANPTYAVEQLGEDFGPYLSFLYAEIRAMIRYAYESRFYEWTVCCEMFLEVYYIFTNSDPIEQKLQEVKQTLYYNISDYCDITVQHRVREGLDPQLSLIRDIVINSDLQDLRYLYQYGAFIGKNELETAAYLNALPYETIRKMAQTYVDGYCKGFELAGVDLAKKPLIEVRYCIGFERVIREAILQFESMGHQIVCYQPALDVMNRRPGVRIGCLGSAANEQYEYDHQFDIALFLDHALKERKLSVYRTAYENLAELAAGMAGPAVLETFGEELFIPMNKKEAPSLTTKQQKLFAKMQSECSHISYEFINGEERSFTIISFPIPAIGEHFEEIFNETIRLNTLDYGKYREIQEKLIDVLDKCNQVVVKGKGTNTTELTVQLHPLENPDRESIFENCLADVNIPLGEVFTSPILTGTNGLLHVSEVYIRGLCYRNLKIWVKDGMVSDYTCGNFDSEEENKALIRSNILGNYDTLPMGECAIGTNTVAYHMAKKYHIFNKLKILIAEKTGPHFAFGDTCYSNSEERRVYNPDGKEIIAKDNEISLLRKTDPQKAYFGCHTDITIPYDELDSIYGLTKSGEKLFIIRNGRFVVEGTEELNIPLKEI